MADGRGERSSKGHVLQKVKGLAIGSRNLEPNSHRCPGPELSFPGTDMWWPSRGGSPQRSRTQPRAGGEAEDGDELAARRSLTGPVTGWWLVREGRARRPGHGGAAAGARVRAPRGRPPRACAVALPRPDSRASADACGQASGWARRAGGRPWPRPPSPRPQSRGPASRRTGTRFPKSSRSDSFV